MILQDLNMILQDCSLCFSLYYRTNRVWLFSAAFPVEIFHRRVTSLFSLANRSILPIILCFVPPRHSSKFLSPDLRQWSLLLTLTSKNLRMKQ